MLNEGRSRLPSRDFLRFVGLCIDFKPRTTALSSYPMITDQISLYHVSATLCFVFRCVCWCF
jgi:hypothetical protein